MATEDLDDLPLDDLIERALVAAHGDPSADDEHRWDMVHALRLRRDPVVFELAAAWCRSTEPLLRALGADVLAQLHADDERAAAQRRESVLAPLLVDPDPRVVAATVAACGHLDIVASHRLALLATHPDADVRFSLATALGERDDDAAIDALLQLVEDEDASVRDWATFGIGTMQETDTPRIRAALLARLEDDDLDTRHEAMVGLARRRDPRVLPHLQRALLEPDIYALAIEAAGLLGDARLLPLLEQLLPDMPDDKELLAAIATLREA